MTLKSDAKFEEKLTCGLENDLRNLANFHQSTRNSQNWDFDFYPKQKMYALKLTKELCVMIMKNDAKFGEELACRFNIDMRDLRNFEPSTQKSQKPAL